MRHPPPPSRQFDVKRYDLSDMTPYTVQGTCSLVTINIEMFHG